MLFCGVIFTAAAPTYQTVFVSVAAPKPLADAKHNKIANHRVGFISIYPRMLFCSAVAASTR